MKLFCILKLIFTILTIFLSFLQYLPLYFCKIEKCQIKMFIIKIIKRIPNLECSHACKPFLFYSI